MVSLLIFAMQGCQKAPQDEPKMGSGNLLRISTRAMLDGDAKENAIRTLRLVVFNANTGSQTINKLFMTADVASSAIPGNYTYFIKDSEGNYEISELLKKNDIKILLIANEMSDLSDKTMTIEQVKGSILNFRDQYSVGSRTEIDITADPAASTNKGYIPMFSESEVLSQGLWDAAAGKQIRMAMKRSLAKVSIVVKGSDILSPDFVNGDVLEIQSVSVGRMAQFNYLSEIGVEYRAAFTSTPTVNFANPIRITKTNFVGLSTDKLTFYVPEFVMSENFLNGKQYCYLQVNALYTQVSGATIQTSFRIPLGDGVRKLYETPSVGLDNLTTKDLSITRNNYYNFEATISSIGTLEALHVDATVKDWQKTVDVDGDVVAPVLNISTQVSKMSEDKVRVYFWNNRADVFIEPQGTKNGVNFQVNDVFVNASASAGVSTSNFKIFNSADGQHFPFNGYIELQFKDLATYTGDSDVYNLIFKTGKLTRNLTVEANPVIGQVKFDANGGAFAGGENQLVYDIRLSEVGLNHSLIGSIMKITDPNAGLSHPGSRFTEWTYTRNGTNVAISDASGKVSVTMNRYVTTLYAAWAIK